MTMGDGVCVSDYAVSVYLDYALSVWWTMLVGAGRWTFDLVADGGVDRSLAFRGGACVGSVCDCVPTVSLAWFAISRGSLSHIL